MTSFESFISVCRLLYVISEKYLVKELCLERARGRAVSSSVCARVGLDVHLATKWKCSRTSPSIAAACFLVVTAEWPWNIIGNFCKVSEYDKIMLLRTRWAASAATALKVTLTAPSDIPMFAAPFSSCTAPQISTAILAAFTAVFVEATAVFFRTVLPPSTTSRSPL